MVLKHIKKICQKFLNYVFYTENPLIQIFYFIIGPLAYAVYCYTVYWKYLDVLGYTVVLIGNIITWIGLYYYYKAWKSDPGTITKDNYEQEIVKYKSHYDEMSFKQDNECSTCNFKKPARSKHCALCNRCVAVFDHHCPWVRNCVAQKNIVYFVRFIFYHFLFCAYKFCLSTYLIIREAQILSKEFGIKKFSSFSQYSNFMLLIFVNNQFLFFFFMWTAFTTFALYVFFTTLVSKFMDKTTTNEEFKHENTMDFLQQKLKNINNKLMSNQYKKEDLQQYSMEIKACCQWYLKKEQNYNKKNRLKNILNLVVGSYDIQII